MIYMNPFAAAPAISQQLTDAQRIVILTHVSPDGDAIGSMLAVYHALQALGKDVHALASSDLPNYARWLPGVDNVTVYEIGMHFPEADLVVMVDTATLSRIGPIYDEAAQTLVQLPIVIVDHHVTNNGHGTVDFIDATAASTCEMLFQLFSAMELPITPDIATCLLLGLTTDTQSFQTSSTRAESLHVAAELLKHGADQERVTKEVYYTLPASSAALIGHALYGLHVDGPIAWTTVTQEMMRDTQAEDEAGDEVVRMMQRIAGVKALVLFKERFDGTTKISLRSQPAFNVAALAQEWGGGGHSQAAGATLHMPPSEALEKILPQLRALVGVTE
ncbi:MAG: phosphoesterase [Chloroflexi bacterium AL-W]|nr:phosphoesterase [Chloroflexi bacterium AL-N1]NOK64811.1 phosphoesterase [Chloroflexi bacterium AL-N10]NOK76581.1 phosphoesterase [Chloroflexi bacterium AL-N5]NOK80189.1 phosphoesterase [Chloroflexi bacterium AL-W]NOK86702.1 phosphoesterase [Chloroflexi bacterium AL-N15]